MKPRRGNTGAEIIDGAFNSEFNRAVDSATSNVVTLPLQMYLFCKCSSFPVLGIFLALHLSTHRVSGFKKGFFVGNIGRLGGSNSKSVTVKYLASPIG